MQSYIPKVNEAFNADKQPFNYRMSALSSLSAMMGQLREDHITEHIVPTLMKACSDKVPNVQFCASKIIKEHRSRIASTCMQDIIIPKLRENMQDSDKDVAHYAKLAAEDL